MPLHNNHNIKFSYYYGRLVHEGYVNPEFYKKIEPDITEDIFSNKKNITIFMARAFIAYSATINENVRKNIAYTKSTEYDICKLFKDTGFNNISEDIFN